jgi:hypothetical protein
VPKTGESNKERRERTLDKGSYRGEQGTKDHWMFGDTETARRSNEDAIYEIAQRRKGRKGLFAGFQRDDDTAEIMDRAKDHNKYFNPNTRGSEFAKGGKVKKYARGGGIESKGKTKGRFV